MCVRVRLAIRLVCVCVFVLVSVWCVCVCVCLDSGGLDPFNGVCVCFCSCVDDDGFFPSERMSAAAGILALPLGAVSGRCRRALPPGATACPGPPSSVVTFLAATAHATHRRGWRSPATAVLAADAAAYAATAAVGSAAQPVGDRTHPTCASGSRGRHGCSQAYSRLELSAFGKPGNRGSEEDKIRRLCRGKPHQSPPPAQVAMF